MKSFEYYVEKAKQIVKETNGNNPYGHRWTLLANFMYDWDMACNKLNKNRKEV